MSDNDVVLFPSPIGHALGLVGILFFCATYNVFLFWLFSSNPAPPDWLEMVMIGAWAGEPMLFALWTALGPGRIATRLSLVIPAMLIVVAAPSAAGNNDLDFGRNEFIAMCISGALMMIASTVGLLILRWLLNWSLERYGDRQESAARRFQFSIRYLIVLTTLWAVALGLTGMISFEEPNAIVILGPRYFAEWVSIGGATMLGLLSPVLAVPLSVLSVRISARWLAWSVGTWLVMTAAVLLVWVVVGLAMEIGELLTTCFFIQNGAALAGACVAIAFRAIGYRLVSLPQASSQFSGSEI